jgi:hypothetical protein
MLSEIIKQKIEERFGKAVRYPKDCEALASIISSVCNERVSASTLKRLYGFVKGVEQPRQFTLDLIAQYIDFPDWDALINKINNVNYSEFISLTEITTDNLVENEIIEFGYKPERNLAVKFLGKQQFEVIKSEKSKLTVGDIITVYHFVLGYPLLINEVKRNNKHLGQYIAGKLSGLAYIRKVENEN